MNVKDEIEEIINEALKKVGGEQEKDICKFLPADSGGYMHHFTMKKMKKTDSETFRQMLCKFILDPKAPRAIDPKPRARRNKPFSINQTDLKLILKLARETGDKQLLTKLGTKLSLSQLKRELIKSIKENRLEEELWSSYVQAIETFHGDELV